MPGGEGLAAPLSEHEILVLLVQLVLLVGVARLLGALARLIGQPPVVGQLIAGVLLGPSVFSRLLPSQYEWAFEAAPGANAVIFGLAWLGVIVLLVVIGYETDLGIIAQYQRAALFVSGGSLVIPIMMWMFVGLLAPSRFFAEGASRIVFAGFFALALSVSALPVVAKILSDLNLLRRDFGQITLAAGMTMDGVGWLMLAVLSGIAREQRLDISSLASSIGGLIVFLALVVTFGRWAIDRLYRAAMAMNSSVAAAVTTTLVAALGGAAITQALGLEAILGAFIVGILLATTRHQLPEVRERLETMTVAFFGPIFFAFSGLRADLRTLDGAAIAWAIAVVILAVVAKIGGTLVGARLAGLSVREGLALGSGLSALGAMGIVVALVGLNVGVLSEAGYTVLVLAAIATSLIAPQLLRLVVAGWKLSDEEEDRLLREELRDGSMILGATRALLPTRGGPSSVFAARILDAVFDPLEITVLTVDVRGRFLVRKGGASSGASQVLNSIRRASSRSFQRSARDPAAAILGESRYGYDLIAVGATERRGGRPTVVERVLAGASIPMVVVRFPAGVPEPEGMPTRVLVPVTGSAGTRPAEEFAYALMASTGGSVLALHVVNLPEAEGVMREEAMVADSRKAGTELLAGATMLAARFGVQLETTLRVATSAEKEIVERANSGDFDVLILGSSTRPLTNRPFFGHRVSYVLENSRIPTVVISAPFVE